MRIKLLTLWVVFVSFFVVEETWALDKIYYVEVEGVVNVRSEPRTDAPIVYQLQKNMVIDLINQTKDWSYISFEGAKGYLLSKYIVEKEEIETKVTDIFYHTLGYERVGTLDDLIKTSFVYNMPIPKLVETTSLNNDDLSYPQFVKTTNEKRLMGKRIVVDPGHGGNEAGASAFGVKEGEQTLALGLVVKQHLEQEGATVILTVDETTQAFRRVSLRERASTARRYDGDVFISLHYNMNDNPSAVGTETYYNRTPSKGEQNPYPDESERLANYLQTYVVASTGSHDLGTKDNEYHVLRNNTVPSALMEVAFLSNQDEAKKLQTKVFQEQVAFGLTQGLIRYFE